MADEKQMLIEALKKSHDERFTPGVYEHSIYGKAALLLEKSVEVVHGRWILADDGDGDVCSVCGTDFCNVIYETGNWNYCPNCGAKMDGGIKVTAKELHEQKIIPLRLELQQLEKEYRELYRKECGEKIGEKASCKNCAYSCVLSITDHNGCMGGKCTCCNDWCYKWIPENEMSKFLRENYHYDDSIFYRLDDVFGSDFLNECNTPQKVNVVMEMLQLMRRFDGKTD